MYNFIGNNLFPKSTIDVALRRRFSCLIHIKPPTIDDRIALIKNELCENYAVTKKQFRTLAQLTSGFSSSDVTRAVASQFTMKILYLSS